MHSSKNIFFILCLSISQSLFSQDADNVKQSFYARYQLIGNYKLADWDAFVEGYNATAAPIEKLGDFKQLINYDIGYRFTFNRVYSSLSYQHYHGRASASFLNNEKRQFDMYANAVSWGFGIKLGKKNRKFSVSPFVNMRIGDRVRIVSDYIYADGFHSRGSDKNLNGTYMGQGLLGEELGVLLKYSLSSKIAIEVECSKMWANLVAPSTMDDKSLYKAFSGGGAGSNLPQDYATYNTNAPQYTLDNGKFVHDKISATKLMIGISYTFSNKQNSTWWQ